MDSWSVIINKTKDFEINKGITSFINPYSMLLLRGKKEIAREIDFWSVDGISLVKFINWKFKKKISRYSFDDTSIAPNVFNYAIKNNLKIAVIGTKEELIYKAVSALEKKYKTKISYFRNGYFGSNEEILTSCQHIIKQKIEIVICGMGTPYQEQFLGTLKCLGWNGYGFTCGGFLHQVASKANYYPKFFDKYNLRWLYRILDEPKLLKRYLVQYPYFFILLLFFKKS